jgi:hypothetical protein
MCDECTNNALAEEMDYSPMYCENCGQDASAYVSLPGEPGEMVCLECLDAWDAVKEAVRA